MPDNEGKACDAIIRVLEARTGAVRSSIRRPENDGVGPPVELRLDLGDQNYAIEHTLVEAFPGQILHGEQFARFIEPVVDELSEHLPGPAVYHLNFPADARLGVQRNHIQQLRVGFTAWVREHARELHENFPEKPTRERHPHGFEGRYRGTPPGFPYEVSLHRESHWSLSPRYDGVLLVARYGLENLEEQRIIRLRTALGRKCPKLHRCKEEGARTVLVLEDSDIALSNHALIGDALIGLLQERPDLPDEIYLVETSVKTWSVRILKDDQQHLPEVDSIEIDSTSLVDMTA